MAQVIGIGAGSVEYSVEDAKIRISDLIEALQEAVEDGAEFIVGFSGNYRGAQYVRLSTDVEHLEEREEGDEY